MKQKAPKAELVKLFLRPDLRDELPIPQGRGEIEKDLGRTIHSLANCYTIFEDIRLKQERCDGVIW